MNVLVKQSHFALQKRLAQHCPSTILQLKYTHIYTLGRKGKSLSSAVCLCKRHCLWLGDCFLGSFWKRSQIRFLKIVFRGFQENSVLWPEREVLWPLLGRSHRGAGEGVSQLWHELAEPRAEEVRLLETTPGQQACPAGLTSGSFSPRRLGTGHKRKGWRLCILAKRGRGSGR